MSEQWDFVPVFEADAERKGVVARLNTAEGMEYSAMSLPKAKLVRAELDIWATKFADSGPMVLAWAICEIANDLAKAIATCEEARTTPTPSAAA